MQVFHQIGLKRLLGILFFLMQLFVFKFGAKYI